MIQLYHRKRPLPSGALILTYQDISDLITLDDCIEAVEGVFRLAGEGRELASGVLAVQVPGGAFHTKAAALTLGRPYFGAKTNGNFPGNRSLGLPTIQGVIVLADGTTGTPLALLDSMAITTLRTGAATAVAVKYLARTKAVVVAICGCGVQGRIQLRAIAMVRRVSRAFAYDTASGEAQRFASEMGPALGIPITPIVDLAAAADTDIWVTCTTSRRPFLTRAHVAAGAFVAAVGADNPEKCEVDADLLAASTVVADVLDQCATIGDLHHAIAAGRMHQEDVRAELGEIVAGRKPGRTSEEEIVVFDSTGTALQDVAAAALAYERALERGGYSTVALGA